MITEEEQAWLTRLDEMFPFIEQWAQRTRTGPVTAQPGSSLARDDEIYPILPPSHLAYGGIVTATEHLEFFRVSFQSNRTLYPASHFTLLRTALMGAAQAVWVLKGPQAQRCERALRLVRDDIQQQRGLLRDVAAQLAPEDCAAQQQLLDRRLREVQDAAAQLGLDPAKVPGWKLFMTEVIQDASELVHGDKDTWYGTSLLWRLQSGHAHGTPSARFRQILPDQLEHRANGMLWGRFEASFAEVGCAAAGAFLLLQEAWWLYDRRCQPG